MDTPSQGSAADAVFYRPFRDGDETKILALFNDVFGKNFSLSRWRWANARNPLGSTLFNLATVEDPTVGDVIVGQSAGVPQRYLHAGRAVATQRIQNVMVHSDHRLKGVFLSTLRNLTRDIAAGGGDFVLTFPNDNSLPAFIQKLDYHHVFDLHVFELSTDKLKNAAQRGGSMRLEETRGEFDFMKEDFDLVASCLAGVEIRNDRDAEYLAWRYHPDSECDYSLFRVRHGDRLVGLAICKLYDGGASLDLLEFVVQRGFSVPWILAAIQDRYERPFRKFNLWLADHYPLYEELLVVGFTRTGLRTHVVCKAFTERASAHCLQKDSYYLSLGDSDVY